MLLLFILTQGSYSPSASPVNLGTVLGELWPALNATGANDAVWWTEADLLTWMDEAAKRFARKTGAFVKRDTSIDTTINVAAYSLPSDHLATVQADLGGRMLAARNVQELEARDSAWPATTGKPEAFLEDTQGLQEITLYKKPTADYANLPLGLVERFIPPTIAADSAFIVAPQVLREYFFLHALAEARGVPETNASMPEIEQWARGLAGMIEQAASQYWGKPA